MTTDQRPEREFLTCKQVAELLVMDVMTLRRWIKQKRFPAIRIGKEFRVRYTEFEQWLEGQRDAPPVSHGGLGRRKAKDSTTATKSA